MKREPREKRRIPSPHSRALRARGTAVLLLVAIVATFATMEAQAVRDADLDRIRGEISRLKSRLEDVHRQAKSAQQELETVDLELQIRTQELALAVDTEQKLDAERRGIESQIEALAPKIDQQKQSLARRLNALYRVGGMK